MKKKRECSMCDESIKTSKSLIELDWTIIRNDTKKKTYYFCPKHTSEEIAEHVIDDYEAGG